MDPPPYAGESTRLAFEPARSRAGAAPGGSVPIGVELAPGRVVIHRAVPGGAVEADPVSVRELEAAVLRAVNAARARAGSPPLRATPGLDRAARRYSVELAGREVLEHRSPTPGRRTFRQRIHAEGIRARLAGENLAMIRASPEMLAERAVRAWMRSAGHRRNLLDPAFARSGIGVWVDRKGVWYVVQKFATAA